mgnify:CR=1 FL=1
MGLTSQLFGNIYMNEFDHWVKRELGIKHYGRYVDDFVLIHESKGYLQSVIPKLSDFLLSTLRLTLHPDKIYLQHYSKGVKYLGAVIKPHKTYIANRTKGNFYTTIEKQNQIARDHKPTKEEQQAFQSSMNSYLGIMKHYKSYKLRKSMIFKNLSAWWWNYFYLSGGIAKFNKKNKTLKKNSGIIINGKNGKYCTMSERKARLLTAPMCNAAIVGNLKCITPLKIRQAD